MNFKKTLSLFTLLAALMVFAVNTSAQTISWYNAGSQKTANTNFDAGTSGTMGTMYISSPIFTTDNTDYSGSPVTIAPNGFRIIWNDCKSGVSKALLMYGIYTVGTGAGAYNQINFYIPNSTGTQPNGTCDDPGGNSRSFTIEPDFNQNSGNSTTINRSITDAHVPGIYGSTAIQHYNVTRNAYTAIATCNATPSSCPVSTSGVLNYLITYGTGGARENSSSVAARLYYSGGASWYSPTVTYYGSTALAFEQGNIQLVSNAVGTFDFILATPGAFGTIYESGWYRTYQVKIGAAD